MRLTEVHTAEVPGLTSCYSGGRTAKSSIALSAASSRKIRTIVSHLATGSYSILLRFINIAREDSSNEEVKKKNWGKGGVFQTYAESLENLYCGSSTSSQPQEKNFDTSCYCQAHDLFYPPPRSLDDTHCYYEVFSLQHRNRMQDTITSDGRDDTIVEDGKLAPKTRFPSQSSSLATSSAALATDSKTDLIKGSNFHGKEDHTLLVIRRGVSQKMSSVKLDKQQHQQKQFIPIECQPLPLHFSELCFEDGKKVTALFVGTTIEPYFKLYLENNITHLFEESIASVDIDHNPILPDDLSSPTMSLSTTYDDRAKIHYLAIGSQNGMVTIVAFRLGESISSSTSGQFLFSPHLLFRERFYIDGPLLTMCFHIDMSPIVLLGKYHIDLVIGSLRSFACMYRKTVQIKDVITRTTNTNAEIEERFNGPSVIVEGLFSKQLKVEDSVLCVYKFNFATRSGSVIAVGTYSGRLLLFDPLDDVDKSPSNHQVKYRLMFSRSFNSPIHGIVAEDLDGDRLPELLITTLKRIHIFRFDSADLASMVHQKVQDILTLKAGLIKNNSII
jgi:hypothetical protein